MSFGYRLHQGFRHLFSRLPAEERSFYRSILSPEEGAIFEGMHPADQLHGNRVARMLLAQGAPPYVLQAALLHDCGKPPSFGLLARTWAVLFGSKIKSEHPARGAEKLSGLLSPEAIALVLHHHGEANLPWLKELQAADSRN